MYRSAGRILLALALVASVACSGDDESMDSTTMVEDPLIEPPPAGQGFEVSMKTMVMPGEEAWVCDIYKLPNEKVANVNKVEVSQTPGTHHLTLSVFGLLEPSTLTPGRYNCKDLYGDESLMDDQIMIYGNQGTAKETLLLPEGVAATLPSGLDVIYEMHFVNSTDEPVELYSYVNAWTIPSTEVKEGVWGGTVRDENINIPAGSTHSEWSRCVMNEDVEVLFLASHTHQLGTNFTIAPFDGTTVGDVFFENDDWQIPNITQFDPPLVVKKGEGFEWTCTWNNPGSEGVIYGQTATDEMCNMALVHTPLSTTARCEVVETSDGVLWDPDAM